MPQELPEGSVLADRYVIEQRLGDGSMGTVYRARHVRFGRQFAIKILHRSLTEDPKVLLRFEREAELAGRLRHTNVASVVDVGIAEGGVHYMAMEFAPGHNLAQLLADGPMSETRVLDLAKQLCSGLAHAHDVGLVHRDFKPENVIVEHLPGGRELARIVDWGVAILLDDAGDPNGDRLTTKGIVLGTPHYMAPEQARGIAIDHRIDIYALGLICYELLTGVLPFDGDGVDIARANLESPTPPMRERAPNVRVDPVLEALVRQLLEKDPDARPPSAHAVRELFELYEHDRAGCALRLGIALPAERVATEQAPRPTGGAHAEGTHEQGPRPAGGAPGERAHEPAHHDPERDRTTEAIEQQAGRRRLALVAGVVAGVLAIVLWLGLRGSDHGATRAASADDRGRVTAMPIVEEPAPEPAPPSPADSDSDSAPAEAPHAELRRVARSAKPAAVHAATTPAAAQPAATPAVVQAPSAADVAALYGALGRELRELEETKGIEATMDLWPRYRWIRINDWLATPERRAEVTAFLEKLRADMLASR